MVQTANPTHRTAHQIVDGQGKPAETSITSNLWVSDEHRFADVRAGNRVKYFVTGKAYFADLLDEMSRAQSQILIAGWQVAWDALLAPGIRLYDALYRAARRQPALKIYVMPWDDHEPVQTYDDQTVAALKVINARLGRTQLFARTSPTFATTNSSYFAHHQKQVVIDGRVAYVGGMDLTYGRLCDEHFDLQADSQGREGLNRYNGCVAQVGAMPQSKCADPDLLSGAIDNYKPVAVSEWTVSPTADVPSNAEIVAQRIHDGGWQPKYEAAGKVISGTDASTLAEDEIDATTLDASRQPRMPWQDVHCRIDGPAVADLMRNFIDRWNIKATSADRLIAAPSPSSFARVGNTFVQVLRSAPANHCQMEAKFRSDKSGGKTTSSTQHDIMTAMLKLIEKSRRFIYIENQFFVSDFGREEKPGDLSGAAQFINRWGGQNQNRWANVAADFGAEAKWRLPGPGAWMGKDHSAALHPPANQVVPALLERIKRSALSGSAFHVYITLPVHPEGCLSDATVVVQMYWTMQTISFGSNSLLNGIRRIIKARKLLKAKDHAYERVFDPGNTEYLDVDLAECGEFVTLLNLRSWVKLGDRYLSEQIYVHSKTMIVDDMYALIGSANINDRSLLGDRDSELAVLVMDGETLRADVNGKGSQREVRRFAHDLRRDLWKKIFGITDGKAAASELAYAVEHPGEPSSWKLIQARAKQNASIFEGAFNWIPRSQDLDGSTDRFGASILPTWDRNAVAPRNAPWSKGQLLAPMPFQTEFWNAARHSRDGVAALGQVRGFITALPIHWTRGENNRFEYPTSLVADNETNPETGTDEVAAERPMPLTSLVV